MQDKIAIIGSCVSEDWIHFRDFSVDWPFELPPMRQHSSLVSLFSPAIEVPVGDIAHLKVFEQKQICFDFDKSFPTHMAQARPRMLILDFAIDSLCGVIRHGEGWVTNSHMLRRTPLRDALRGAEVMSPRAHPERYLAELSRSARALSVFMRNAAPSCRIIIHKCRFAERAIDKDGTVKSFSERMLNVYRSANRTLQLMEQVAERELDCEVMSLIDGDYRADARHVWGLGGMHFERRYYVDFTAGLMRLLSKNNCD